MVVSHLSSLQLKWKDIFWILSSEVEALLPDQSFTFLEYILANVGAALSDELTWLMLN